MAVSDRVRVRVLNVTRESPHPSAPLRATPLKLSFFDALWIGIPPIRRLLFYRPAPPLASLLPSLKSSLSRALHLFRPLAGNLTVLSSSDGLAIAHSADDSVAFVEAEADGDLNRLIDDEVHDWEAFRSLVPDLEGEGLPAPLLAVQATEFEGGVAVGVTFSHVAADGRAIWSFVKAWAEMCRGVDTTAEAVVVLCDRRVIVHPSGDRIARRFLDVLAPALPKMPQLSTNDADKLVRRTFTLDSANIQLLKDQILSSDDYPSVPISTFVAVSAHILVNTTQAKRLSNDENMFLIFLADCRSHLNPPVDESYFGNCVKICIVEATAGELIGEGGFIFACKAIQKVIREASEDPLKDCENWHKVFSEVPMTRLVNVAASPRFRVYDTDFGWGKPSRVELVSMNHDGAVVLVDGKDGGGVQVSMTLPSLQMDEFTSLFYCLGR